MLFFIIRLESNSSLFFDVLFSLLCAEVLYFFLLELIFFSLDFELFVSKIKLFEKYDLLFVFGFVFFRYEFILIFDLLYEE